MRSILQWIGSHGEWSRSRFSDLPAPASRADDAVRHWQTVAGGLALILSRASRAELAERFPASHELYQVLRRRLRHGRRVDANTALLLRAIRETSGIADPMTHASLAACVRERAQRRTEHESGGDEPTTVLNMDVFQQRSSSLRRTVATARTTGFAELH